MPKFARPTEREIYGSHIKVLEALAIWTVRAVEFGGGDYSTPTLLESVHLTTVENDRKWTQKLIDRHAKQRWDILTPHTLEETLDIARTIEFCSLALVDSSPDEWRWKIGRALFDRRFPTVVFHDWEAQRNCGYWRLRPPREYESAIYRHELSKVRTAVFSLHKLPEYIEHHEVVPPYRS